MGFVEASTVGECSIGRLENEKRAAAAARSRSLLTTTFGLSVRDPPALCPGMTTATSAGRSFGIAAENAPVPSTQTRRSRHCGRRRSTNNPRGWSAVLRFAVTAACAVAVGDQNV